MSHCQQIEEALSLGLPNETISKVQYVYYFVSIYLDFTSL